MIPEWLINIWIAAMLLIMVGWDQREDAPLKWSIHPLLPFIRWVGLWHCWNMFAPEVNVVTLRAEVVVKFADGGTAIWNPPGWIPSTPWGAFRRLRWRKTLESSLGREHRSLRPCICRFGMDQVLESLSGDIRRVPVEVDLVQVAEPILWPHETDRSRAETRTVIHRMRVEQLPSARPEVN